ncbi:D-tyrosyl-tRNA(Tyr) deacylase [Actinomycetaceae bacterium TAE3-ERU4]|nr:D-tyrosyl-tRNA(Tyr) deacylase [Actinomycetaceae bacterium TAE3-ERU4]
MRAVIQRATKAKVSVSGKTVGQISEPGLVVLLGVTHDDTPEQAKKIAEKIANLRILRPRPGDDESPEISVLEAGAPVLLVSQFTLYGATKKGRRPSWTAAAPGPVAQPLYEEVLSQLRTLGVHVEVGSFGAMMEVELVNDGPYTLLVEV